MALTTLRRWGVGLGALGSFVLAGALVLSAPRLASAGRAEPANDAARGAQQPPQPTPQGNLVAQGRQVFNRTCNRCHPGGQEDVGPRLIGLNWQEARMVRQIRNGGGTMRPINTTRLPDSELPALMAYLRTIRAVR